jgi:hypothetical protein
VGQEVSVFSKRLDICGLLALGTLLHLEAHFLLFLQRFEAAALDLRKMREQVFSAIVWRDKTKALCIVEPLHCTRLHHLVPKKLKKVTRQNKFFEMRCRRCCALADAYEKSYW